MKKYFIYSLVLLFSLGFTSCIIERDINNSNGERRGNYNKKKRNKPNKRANKRAYKKWN